MTVTKRIPVADRVFVDSNVLLYTVDEFEDKAQRAYEILDQNPVITVQVLNEFANVALRRYRLPWDDVRDGLEHITECCEVLPLSHGIHVKALEIAEANLIGIYDANIVAAAELSGCTVLYTEDLNHSQQIGSVFIRNPFAGS